MKKNISTLDLFAIALFLFLLVLSTFSIFMTKRNLAAPVVSHHVSTATMAE